MKGSSMSQCSVWRPPSVIPSFHSVDFEDEVLGQNLSGIGESGRREYVRKEARGEKQRGGSCASAAGQSVCRSVAGAGRQAGLGGAGGCGRQGPVGVGAGAVPVEGTNAVVVHAVLCQALHHQLELGL